MTVSSIFIPAESPIWNIIASCLGLFLVLLPTLFKYNFESLRSAPISKSILSIEAQFSYGILLVSTVPFVMDTLLDYKQLYAASKWRLYIFGRVPMVLCSMLIGIQYCMITTTPSIFGLTNNRAETFLLCNNCFRIVGAGSMMYTLTTVKPEIFTIKLTVLYTLTPCIVSLLRILAQGSSKQFYSCCMILLCSCLLGFVMTLIWWGYKIYSLLHCYTVNDYTCILYMIISLVTMFGAYAPTFQSWLKTGRFSEFSTLSPEGLAITNYAYVFLLFMLTIAPGRIARFESVVHLVSEAYAFVDAYFCMYLHSLLSGVYIYACVNAHYMHVPHILIPMSCIARDHRHEESVCAVYQS